ncbi:hypothetical protein HUT11_16935 [Streptomyces seoulensis]|nr:hypothetical protein HUT11_16935 [Streptomyces seoulensis]
MELLTEHHPVSGPAVYGFLRLFRSSRARQGALLASLAEYCRGHELQLSDVFTDRDASGPDSAAFAGLMDVLALPDVYGVLVPAMSHLGPKAMAAERGRRIEAAGSRLLLIRKPRAAHHSVHRSGLVRAEPPAAVR